MGEIGSFIKVKIKYLNWVKNNHKKEIMNENIRQLILTLMARAYSLTEHIEV